MAHAQQRSLERGDPPRSRATLHFQPLRALEQVERAAATHYLPDAPDGPLGPEAPAAPGAPAGPAGPAGPGVAGATTVVWLPDGAGVTTVVWPPGASSFTVHPAASVNAAPASKSPSFR